ncbi:MAG: hypothetical protein FI715_02755 [SAR202 cluster bacterium]|nr:hypothetical protein [SAR202 cluster bacterium]
MTSSSSMAAAASDGSVYVTDVGNHRVKKFSERE